MQYSDDADDSSEISPIQSNDSVKENLQFTYITSTPSQNTGLVRLRKQQLAAHVQANNHPTQLQNLFNQPVRQTTPPTPVATTATATTTTSRPIPSSFVPTPTTTKPKPLAEKQFSFAPTTPTTHSDGLTTLFSIERNMPVSTRSIVKAAHLRGPRRRGRPRKSRRQSILSRLRRRSLHP